MAALPVELDNDTLIPVVGRALGQRLDHIGPWTAEPLAYNVLNPVSQGMYRVSGSAQIAMNTVPWSVVLKICREPSDADFAHIPPDLRRTLLKALRWDREVDVYASDLLANLPRGLAAPRCFATERSNGSARIWLEHVVEDGIAWDVPRYALAARHLGRFNGTYLAGRPTPKFPWLSRRWLQDWVRPFTSKTADLLADDRVWAQPLTKELFPAEARTELRALLGEHDRWWGALEDLPLTVSHLDAFRANLLSRTTTSGVETVAVDWSFVGTAPLGAEVAQLVIASLFYHGDPADPVTLERQCLDGYVEGLGDADYRVPIGELRRAYVINAVTRWLFIFGPLGVVGDAAREAAIAQRRGMPFRDLLERIAAKTRHLCGLSREVVLH